MRVALALVVLMSALASACAAPIQNGGVIVLPGAMERLILAMRLGYGGMGDVKPAARVRRALAREDLPAGALAAGRVGDWLLENQTITVVVADVDRSPRGGHIVDMARAPARIDGLGRVDTIVSGKAIRYTSVKSGTDDNTGTAYLQVTGHPEGDASLEVVTRYDVAPELTGVLMHTSLKPAGRSLAGAIAVGDTVSFGSGARIATGASDVAAFGDDASYALEPLGEPPFVLSRADSTASMGLAPELVVTTAPEEPFIYSRVLALLERPDDVALAATRASATGQALGEVELELVPSPRRGQTVPGGKFVFTRLGGSPEPLELPAPRSIRPGDRQLAKLPTGRYEVRFEGGGYRTVVATTIHVAPKVLTPVRVQARPDPAPAAPPPAAPEAPPPVVPAAASETSPSSVPPPPP